MRGPSGRVPIHPRGGRAVRGAPQYHQKPCQGRALQGAQGCDPQGETYAIERASLGPPSPNGYTPPLSSPVRDNPSHLSQSGTLAPTDQQAQAEAIVQRLLAPFIAELGEVREELGRVKAECDEQRRRAEAAERECEEIQRRHDALRAAAVFIGPPAPPAATGEAEDHEHDLGDLRPPGRLRRAWRVLRGE